MWMRRLKRLVEDLKKTVRKIDLVLKKWSREKKAKAKNEHFCISFKEKEQVNDVDEREASGITLYPMT